MSNTDNALGCLVAGVFVAAMTFVSALMNGWVLTKLWSWFVVPIFHLPGLGLVQAIGIGVMVSFLTYQTQPRGDESGKDALMRILESAVIHPLIVVVIGYAVAQYL